MMTMWVYKKIFGEKNHFRNTHKKRTFSGPNQASAVKRSSAVLGGPRHFLVGPRRINHIWHVAGNTSPGFAYQDEECILQIFWTAA